MLLRNLRKRMRKGQLSDVEIIPPQADAIPETGSIRIGEQGCGKVFAAITRKTDRSRSTPRRMYVKAPIESATPGKRHDITRL